MSEWAKHGPRFRQQRAEVPGPGARGSAGARCRRSAATAAPHLPAPTTQARTTPGSWRDGRPTPSRASSATSASGRPSRRAVRHTHATRQRGIAVAPQPAAPTAPRNNARGPAPLATHRRNRRPAQLARAVAAAHAQVARAGRGGGAGRHGAQVQLGDTAHHRADARAGARTKGRQGALLLVPPPWHALSPRRGKAARSRSRQCCRCCWLVAASAGCGAAAQGVPAAARRQAGCSAAGT